MSSVRLPLAIYAAVVSLSAGRLSEDAWECLNRYGTVVEASLRLVSNSSGETVFCFSLKRCNLKRPLRCEKKSRLNVPDKHPWYGIEDIDRLGPSQMAHDDRVRNQQSQEAQKTQSVDDGDKGSWKMHREQFAPLLLLLICLGRSGRITEKIENLVTGRNCQLFYMIFLSISLPNFSYFAHQILCPFFPETKSRKERKKRRTHHQAYECGNNLRRILILLKKCCNEMQKIEQTAHGDCAQRIYPRMVPWVRP